MNKDKNWYAGTGIQPKGSLMLIVIAAFALLFVTGCKSLDNLTESVKNKNIAAGSDTWGGNIVMSLISMEMPLPNITLWFGRRKVWYVSIKENQPSADIAAIVAACNTPLSVNAGVQGVGVDNKGAAPDGDKKVD